MWGYLQSCCASGESLRYYSDDLIEIETAEEVTVIDDTHIIELIDRVDTISIVLESDEISIVNPENVTIVDDEDIICGS